MASTATVDATASELTADVRTGRVEAVRTGQSSAVATADLGTVRMHHGIAVGVDDWQSVDSSSSDSGSTTEPPPLKPRTCPPALRRMTKPSALSAGGCDDAAAGPPSCSTDVISRTFASTVVKPASTPA
jgi:hypothetical protein